MSAAERGDNVWAWLRLLAAAAILVSILAQFARTVGRAAQAGQDVTTTVANFFSYFTNEANLLAVCLLTVCAIRRLRTGAGAPQSAPEQATSRPARPRPGAPSHRPTLWPAVGHGVALGCAMACASTYLAITGIVYNLLLRGLPQAPGAIVPWSNEILHVAAPAFLVVDAIVAQRTRLPWWAVAVVPVYPILWVVYTLTRGPHTVNPVTCEPWWYPYPFLNPHNPALSPPGFGGVAVYVVAIALAFLAIGALIVWRTRLRPRRAPWTPVPETEHVPAGGPPTGGRGGERGLEGGESRP